MTFGVRYGEKYEFYKEIQSRGESSPLDDLPELSVGESLYYEDFVVLGTERVNAMSVGAIPITKIVEYAIFEGVEDIHRFKRILSAMDRLYLKAVRKEQDKKAEAAKRKAQRKSKIR